MGRGRKDRTKGAFPRYGKGRAGIALALGRAGSRWCWGTFPTGLEQSSAEDSWPKAGSGALRSSPLLPAHGPSQNEGPAGCGVAAGWGSGRMGLAQGAENTAMGRHSHGNMDQLCFALLPMSPCEPWEHPGGTRVAPPAQPHSAPHGLSLCPPEMEESEANCGDFGPKFSASHLLWLTRTGGFSPGDLGWQHFPPRGREAPPAPAAGLS